MLCHNIMMKKYLAHALHNGCKRVVKWFVIALTQDHSVKIKNENCRKQTVINLIKNTQLREGQTRS